MKKFISAICLFAFILCLFAGCGSKPEYATGEYVFTKIVDVSMKEGLDDYTLNYALESYGVSDVEACCEAALNEFLESGMFENSYIRFDAETVGFYDVVMEREATFVYYETGDNEGFFSMIADLNVADGNPDPGYHPPFVYDASSGTLTVLIGYASFFVTVEYAAK